MASGSAEAWRDVAPLRGTAEPFAAGLAAPRLSDRLRRPLAHRRPFPRRGHGLRPGSTSLVEPGRSVDGMAVRPLRWALWLRSMTRPRPGPNAGTATPAAFGRSPAAVPVAAAPGLHSAPARSAATERHVHPARAAAGQPRLRRVPSLPTAPRSPTRRPPATPLGPPNAPGVAGDEAAPTRAAAAAVFAEESRAHPPLPAPFGPLATAITGSSSVPRVATGARSRAALRSAGKPAATVGRTIHLDRPPDPTSPRTLGVVAHELVHVAASKGGAPGAGGHIRNVPRIRAAAPPWPNRDDARPRFFGDALFDAVEERAGDVGGRVESLARSGVGTVSSAADQVRGTAADTIASVGRSASTLPVSGPGAVMGAAQEAVATVRQEAAEVMSGLESARAQATAVAGEAGDQFSGAVDEARSAATGALERPAEALAGAASSLAGHAGSATEAAGSALGSIASAAQSAAQDAQSQLGDLIEAIEERVLGELERRGGRYAGVF